jgi:hypothetical protein
MIALSTSPQATFPLPFPRGKLKKRYASFRAKRATLMINHHSLDSFRTPAKIPTPPARDWMALNGPRPLGQPLRGAPIHRDDVGVSGWGFCIRAFRPDGPRGQSKLPLAVFAASRAELREGIS